MQYRGAHIFLMIHGLYEELRGILKESIHSMALGQETNNNCSINLTPQQALAITSEN